jgi:hypothetical protein
MNHSNRSRLMRNFLLESSLPRTFFEHNFVCIFVCIHPTLRYASAIEGGIAGSM